MKMPKNVGEPSCRSSPRGGSASKMAKNATPPRKNAGGCIKNRQKRQTHGLLRRGVCQKRPKSSGHIKNRATRRLPENHIIEFSLRSNICRHSDLKHRTTLCRSETMFSTRALCRATRNIICIGSHKAHVCI